MPAEKSIKRVVSNRKARHEYFILETLEAGIELRGTEVKSLREGHADLTGSYCRASHGEVFAHSFNISPYEFGNIFNHDPGRRKRLLLKSREIRRLEQHASQKGHALIPLSVYFRRGRAKLEVAVCRGKRQYDKRETLKRRTADREAQRAISRAR